MWTQAFRSGRPVADLALVKVDNYAKLPPPLELGNSSEVEAGQWAIAIGEPFALHDGVPSGSFRVSSGRKPLQKRTDRREPSKDFCKHRHLSIRVIPADPLIDFEGRAIGINQSVAKPQAGARAIGCADNSIFAETRRHRRRVETTTPDLEFRV
jgi:S1-C subfamily serine protease